MAVLQFASALMSFVTTASEDKSCNPHFFGRWLDRNTDQK
jgi:hypothetical protein